MRDLFAALPDDPAPPLPEDYVDTLLGRGRRSVRRRRIGAAAVWAVVVLALVALVVPGGPLPSRPAAPTAHPALPDHLAGYSMLTATVGRAPAGRAIALYGYGNGEAFNMFQSVVLGADRNTYRQVEAMDERDRPVALLAPDGTRVLLGDDRGATGDLLLVDLGTGRRRSVPIGATAGVRLLAWSPDGRYVAYSTAPVDNTEGVIGFVDQQVARTGGLRLLDLTSGASTELPALKPAWTAAFAPDSRRLAVQVGQVVHLVGLDGRETATVPVAAGRELAADVGWSPDGRFLATVPWAGDGPDSGSTGHGVFLSLARDVAFEALDGTGPPAAVPDVVQVLGWRSAGSVIVLTVDGAGHLALSEVELGTGARRTLARFDTGSTCELGTQSCQVFDLRLATGLLPGLTVRPAGRAERGPLPIAVTIPIGAVVLGAVLLLWRRRGRGYRR